MKLKLLSALLGMALCSAPLLAADSAPKIKVLVVTGGHGFEKAAFSKVFSDNTRLAVTEAAHEAGGPTVFDRDDLATFDAVVLYDMQKSISDSQKKNFLSLLDRGVGLVVLHHAIVSYQHWPEYEKIIGGKYPEEDGKGGVVTEATGYKHDEEVPAVILEKNHPVTAGLQDFVIHDEIYWGFHTTPDVLPLVSTTHPKSGKPLAWARHEGKSRIVYIQFGHDHFAYENENFRRLVGQSISWVARAPAGAEITLPARDVTIHGTTVRYEPQTNKNTIGYWTRVQDWVSWDFEVAQPGVYGVEILQGCGPRSGGSEVEFAVGEQKLTMTVIETKGFQDFLTREIGELRFDHPGKFTLAVVPKRKPGQAVMDLRQVILRRRN